MTDNTKALTPDEIKLRDSELLNKRALQIQRGAARAAVLGVNDGLVSILCIVLAVAAAKAEPQTVLLSGLAGLIAGAISMAAGEWISLKSQVELFQGVLDDLHRLLKEDREILQNQLEDDFMVSGLDKKTAITAAAEIARDDNHLMDEYAHNVMKINPEELGSPWTAAFSSFFLFTVGALFPLTPWFFVHGHTAVGLSIGLTALASLIVGGYVGYTSGKDMKRGALRQLFIIAFASLVTYGIGHLFGVAVS